ncbi:MAG: Crp/Fnr family transcriptional regulator [Myxococcaceae bacterium]
MAKTVRDYRELLAAGRWFQCLSAPFADALVEAGRVREVSAGTRLFARGDAPDGVYAVLDGAIRAAGLGSDGKEAVLALVEPPQWFGEIAVFDGLPRTHDATAVTDARLVHVPAAALSTMLEANPAWWRELALLVTAKLRLAFVMMEDTALLPLAPRVAKRLAFMAEGYGEWADRSRRVVKVRQELLAAMLSASRQSINQALKDLEAKGLIRTSYGEIEILDLDGLRSA